MQRVIYIHYVFSDAVLTYGRVWTVYTRRDGSEYVAPTGVRLTLDTPTDLYLTRR